MAKCMQYAGNFLDFAKTFAGTRIVLLTAYEVIYTWDIPLRLNRPWASTADFSLNWTSFVDFQLKTVDRTNKFV